MFTFTKTVETPEEIANRILGFNDANYAQLIRQANINSMANRTFEGYNLYGSYYPIRLPNNSNDVITEKFDYLHNMLELAFPGNQDVKLLIDLQEAGLDLNHLLSIGEILHAYNQQAQINNPKIVHAVRKGINKDIISFDTELTSTLSERLTLPAEKYIDTIDELQVAAKELAIAKKSGDRAAIAIAEVNYTQMHNQAMKIFNTESALYAENEALNLTSFVTNENSFARIVNKHGVNIHNTHQIHVLKTIIKYGKMVGRGCWAFGAAIGLDEVYEAYEKQEDWMKKAFSKGLDMGTDVGVAAGFGYIVFSRTPYGFVAVISLSLFEGIISYFSEKISDRIFDRSYEWIKEHLKHWL